MYATANFPFNPRFRRTTMPKVAEERLRKNKSDVSFVCDNYHGFSGKPNTVLLVIPLDSLS